jgi:GntR family transcriptional regulator, transcriptional repressor for pyruvate dehydrogenase complex
MSDTSRPAAERRLYQQVADRIRALVQGGEFAPGARLPAERELAQQLGVSRPSLREALIALEIEGSVEIRMGSGVYVSTAPPRTATAASWLGESPSELMQARMAIEGTVAALACARMTPETLAALRRVLDAMAAQIEGGRKPVEQDREFHLLLAGQCGNAILARIVGELFDERHSLILSKLSKRFEKPAAWRAALSEHEAVLSALGSADPIRAQSAMCMHLQASSERWFRA